MSSCDEFNVEVSDCPTDRLTVVTAVLDEYGLDVSYLEGETDLSASGMITYRVAVEDLCLRLDHEIVAAAQTDCSVSIAVWYGEREPDFIHERTVLNTAEAVQTQSSIAATELTSDRLLVAVQGEAGHSYSWLNQADELEPVPGFDFALDEPLPPDCLLLTFTTHPFSVRLRGKLLGRDLLLLTPNPHDEYMTQLWQYRQSDDGPSLLYLGEMQHIGAVRIAARIRAATLQRPITLRYDPLAKQVYVEP